MARSPLIQTFSRAFRSIRGAARAGAPLDEAWQRDAERRALNRRRFLELGAAAATVPLFATGCDEPDLLGNQDVVIVGGGMAGLHCAYRLQGLGITAKVYDASNRLGGRMFSDRKTFPDGMHCELGGELIDTGHATMHDLAAELEIELLDYAKDTKNAAGAAIDPQVFWIGNQRLTMAQVLDGFAPIAAKIDEAYATLDDEDATITYATPNGAEALDALSLSAWFDSIGASGPVRKLLEVAYNIEYGLEPDVTNVLNMMVLISTDTQKFSVFGESDELFHAKDGNDTYIQRLAEALEGQIETGAALQAIRQNPDGRYVLSFARGGGGFDITTDHVVLAIPFTMLRDVQIDVELPEVKVQAIQELGYGTNSKLMCGFSSRPWRDAPHLSSGEVFTDLPFQNTWETSRLQPGDSGIITQYSGGDLGVAAGDGLPSERMAEFLAQFDTVFPGVKDASNGKAARMHWPTYPLTKGSYAAYEVGQYTAFAGAEIERFQNIHFCGEHTSLDAQGYMEGAALTGAMAADEVAADLGVDAKQATAALHAGGRSVLSPAQRIFTRGRLARRHGRWHTALMRLARMTAR